jgi:hypothetical protein
MTVTCRVWSIDPNSVRGAVFSFKKQQLRNYLDLKKKTVGQTELLKRK